MDLTSVTTELDAALLQATITMGLVALFAFLYHRYRKAFLGWWAIAWVLYTLRIGAIVSFLLTSERSWLFVHQVLTGWTAVAILWATLVFAGRTPRRNLIAVLLILFPPIWSWVAIYRLETFLLAAGPAVLFLSAATLAAGVAFLRFRDQTRSPAGAVLGVTLVLWGLHHLDYPLLRARGAWAPWGYYLDIAFILAMGGGTLLLVIEEMRGGLRTLSAMAGDLSDPNHDALDALLQRPLGLTGVRGSGFFLPTNAQEPPPGLQLVRRAGASAVLETTEVLALAMKVMSDPHPRNLRLAAGGFALALPVLREHHLSGVLVITGAVHDPFTALADDFLLTLGRQVGTALERAELQDRLRDRTADLERLSARMIREHEAVRRRLALELHDETAQVFSALKLQAGALREIADVSLQPRVERLVDLVDAGMRSIRSVTDDLRPSVLDDLGLVPALRALIADFRARTGLLVQLTVEGAAPPLGEDTELALFRALQEGLANVVRHANAKAVDVCLLAAAEELVLTVHDDGQGLVTPPEATPTKARSIGLAGMQERISAAGGSVRLANDPRGGALLEVSVPVRAPGRRPLG